MTVSQPKASPAVNSEAKVPDQASMGMPRATRPRSAARRLPTILAKTTWVELKLFFRDPAAAFFTLALPVLLLVSTALAATLPTDGSVVPGRSMSLCLATSRWSSPRLD